MGLVIVGLVAFGVGAALAQVSPSKVTGTTTGLYWSGQGVTNGTLNTQLCTTGTATADPGSGGWQNGATPSSYLLWVFSTDGGSISGVPTLTVNNTTYGNAHLSAQGMWQIVTPYIAPSTITAADKNDPNSTGSAVANFTVLTIGMGDWMLVISHGCEDDPTPPAADIAANHSVVPSFTRTYTWGIAKDVDQTQLLSAGGGDTAPANYTASVTHDGGTDSGWLVTGVITITNPNPAGDDVTGVNVEDSIDDANATCTVGTGSPGSVDPTNATIPGAGSVDFPYTCTYSQAPAASSQMNTETITWPTQTLTDGSLLEGNESDPLTHAQSFDWGSVDPTIVDGSVSVDDTFGGSLGVVSYADPSPTEFTYSRTFADPAGTCTSHTNTATFTTNDTEATGSASATVTDCQGADLEVSKTATGNFNRDYDWSILKTQTTSATRINSSASSVTVGYKLAASWTGPVDSGWTVSGTITVSNPNDWESVALTGVTDQIDNGGVCAITSGDVNATIAAGDSVSLGYTCTYASAPSPAAGTNTATATWDKDAASTPAGSASGSKGVDFGSVAPNVTHDATTVQDTFNGGAALTLGVANIDGTFVQDGGNTLANWTSGYAPGTFTFTYTRSVPVVTNTCVKYDNSAMVSDDATNGDNSSSASVTVCGKITGGLTIGFWSNNNGKAVLCANDPKWRQLLDGTWTTAPYTGGSYLRNGNGTYYAVPSSGTCATAVSNYATWLLNANSTNASYMLSAQLSAVVNNVNLNGMNGNACVAGLGGTPITINNLISDVIAFLRANGNTTTSGAARTKAVNYQAILNSLNNGQTFAVTGC